TGSGAEWLPAAVLSYYFLEKPAPLPPLPNRILGGTNFKADMAPVKPSIWSSLSFRGDRVSPPLEGSPDDRPSAASNTLSEFLLYASLSSETGSCLSGFCDSLVWNLVEGLLRLWPASRRSEFLPS